MSDDRLITVAIHTYDRAIVLKNLLEREGVAVTLQNVNLNQPVISSGVRVRIHESDLPLALRLIENQEIFTTSSPTSENQQQTILVPVDFSAYSTKAAEMAIWFASKHSASIVLLHSYIDPMYTSRLQLSDQFSYDALSEDILNKTAIENEAKNRMDSFCAELLSKMKSGDFPAVKFSSEIVEGVPEEVINQYAKDRKPMLIVMGTRGADTKERELVGSVTAEVLDTCRYPVFTMPDSVEISDPSELSNVVFFSNFDQEDILALDELFHLLPIKGLNVTLVAIPGHRKASLSSESLNALGTYCTEHYPQQHFAIDTISLNSIEEDFARISKQSHVRLIAVPNKKKNILARLFNPGIAHRLLFHSDIPMMVLPV